MSNIPGNLKIFTPKGSEPDAGAIEQMSTCMAKGDALGGALSADHHLGYSMPIGGTIGYPYHVSPSGVGYDIGCGNKAVATNLLYSDISDDVEGLMDEVVRSRATLTTLGWPCLAALEASDGSLEKP